MRSSTCASSSEEKEDTGQAINSTNSIRSCEGRIIAIDRNGGTPVELRDAQEDRECQGQRRVSVRSEVSMGVERRRGKLRLTNSIYLY
jgi:hypothetical protein